MAQLLGGAGCDEQGRPIDATLEGNTDKRVQMYLDIQKEYREIAPIIPLFQKIEQVGMQKNVSALDIGRGGELGHVSSGHEGVTGEPDRHSRQPGGRLCPPPTRRPRPRRRRTSGRAAAQARAQPWRAGAFAGADAAGALADHLHHRPRHADRLGAEGGGRARDAGAI